MATATGQKAIAGKVRAGEIPAADFAVYTEPTTLDVYTAQKGFMIADISVLGESAYFGTPWLGTDALRGAHKVLGELFAHNDRSGTATSTSCWGAPSCSLPRSRAAATSPCRSGARSA